MPGKRVEIAAQGLHINGHVRNGLSAIDQNRDADLFSLPNNVVQRIDTAKRVGDMANTEQSDSLGHQFIKLIQFDFTAIIDGCHD